MSDADLEQIRAARLQQLRAQGGSGGGGPSSPSNVGGDSGEAQKYFGTPLSLLTEAEREARSTILNQILEPSALDRLGRIRLVKESRASEIEDRLIMLARSGQLRQKVNEDQLKELLGAVAEKERQGGEKIVVRRRGWDDDEDEDD
ncbi:MAG: hypothetical protein M1814_006144 [Vezdaea aestivalis]|nr:MAG: hypothetical protein M1814_006144 [Vezdaea aestivalis]